MTKGQKHDGGKPDLSLVPLEALTQMSLAFMAGEKKYDRWNYTKGMEAGRLVAASLRHILTWYEGTEHDKESTELVGKPVHHLGAAMANLAMLIRIQQVGTLIDDRLLPEPAEVTPLVRKQEDGQTK